VWDDDLPPLDRQDKALSPSKNAPAYDARSLLYQLTGVDLVAIPGLHASTVQTIVAEIGLDMGKWPHAKAFCAWLGLAPRHEISGGKVLRRTGLAVSSPGGRSEPEWPGGLLSAHARSPRPQSAIVATAYKIARIIYHLLTHRTSFRDLSPEE
jgi:hypothetical protein